MAVVITVFSNAAVTVIICSSVDTDVILFLVSVVTNVLSVLVSFVCLSVNIDVILFLVVVAATVVSNATVLLLLYLLLCLCLLGLVL